MTRSHRRIGFFFVGLVFLLLLVAYLVPAGLALQVTLVDSGKPLLVLPLKPGERFTLHYYHSVENAPIWEVHSVDKEGRIYIEEERYLKFGAGMGRMPGVGRMVQRGPYEVIENMHLPTGNFILRVGSPGVDHTIIWRGVKKNLSHLVPHKAVQFSAKPVSLLYRMWQYIIPRRVIPG
ncbi:MAG: DUF1850 domain-containing protein [Desulfobacterales bacterium]|nr:MAG: DUF1850 domain-containing protein [Desulfobacterales bacterium]